MVTEADREAEINKATIIPWKTAEYFLQIRNHTTGEHLVSVWFPDAKVELSPGANADEAAQIFWAAIEKAGREMFAQERRHRTASTAALTAENQRLRECLHAIDIEAGNTIPRDGKEAAFAALDRIIRLINPFRLSTPSEVSEPVASPLLTECVRLALDNDRALAASGIPTSQHEYSYEVLKETYDMLHEAATSMGYPSATEALEHLSELREPVADESGGEGEKLRAGTLNPEPCPHCSGEAETFKHSDKVHPYRTVCKGCGASTAYHGDWGRCVDFWNRRATPPNPTNGDAVREAALADFTDYFVRNYPGPDTIIHDPKWHAPRIFRAVLATLAKHGGAEG